MSDKKMKIIYDFEAKGVEDIEKAKLRLDEMITESWKNGFPYDKAHEFYQEIEHIVKEIKKIYPEMNLLEDNFKYILGRKKGDSIDNEVSNAYAVQAGVNSLLHEITASEKGTIKIKNNNSKDIDVPNNDEQFMEQIQKLLLSGILESKFGEQISGDVSKLFDIKDIFDIDYTQEDARIQLEKMIMSKLISLNSTVGNVENIINLITRTLKIFQEEEGFKSPFGGSVFKTFDEFKAYNEKRYSETEAFLSQYLNVEDETKEKLLKIYRDQINIKTQFYKEDYELKKKYGIDQDFSVGDTIYRMMAGENPSDNVRKYMADRQELQTNYDRNLKRNDININQLNLEVAKNINPQDLLKIVSEPSRKDNTTVTVNEDSPTLRQALHFQSYPGLSPVAYLLPQSSSQASDVEQLEIDNEEKKELYAQDAENFAASHEQKGSVLQQFASQLLGDKESLIGLFGEVNNLLGQFGADSPVVTGLLSVAEKHLPKLLGLFKSTNKAINEDVKESTDKRNELVGKGSEKAEGMVKSSLDRIQEHVELVIEGVGMIFDAVNESLDVKIEEAQERYETLSGKYDEVVEKVAESDSRIKELQEEAKNAQGGRLIVIQEQIAREIETRNALADEEKRLAKEKEKAEADQEKAEKQKKKNELKVQLLQTVANTAFGVAKAVSAFPFTFGLPWSAFVAATGAIQAATITKQMSKLADGGFLNGRRHNEGGMRIEGTNIEVEGGEYVINRHSTKRNLGLVSYINSQRRQLTPQDIDGYFASSASYGRKPAFKTMFESGGELPSGDSLDTYGDNAVLRAIESINFQPVVSVVDIANVQQSMTQVTDWTNTR